MKKTTIFVFTICCLMLMNSKAQQVPLSPELQLLQQQNTLPFTIANWRTMNYYDLARMYPVPEGNRKAYKNKPFEAEEDEAGVNQLARWHWFWAPRVSPTGVFPDEMQNYNEWKAYNQLHSAKSGGAKSGTANWTNIPISNPQGGAGIGRIDRIYLVTANGSEIWAGSPSGGLWYSNNGGSTWAIKNESMPILGISGIAVDPTNDSIMYISTGDGEAHQDQSTIGVYKSLDKGTTWAATGFTTTASAATYNSRLVMDMNNPLILFCATNTGLKRTLDGGVTWTSVLAGQARDVRINPGNSSIVMAATNGGIYRSTNGGTSFTFLVPATAGLPTSFNRISLAITPAAPNDVFALYANTSNGFGGLYKSYDGGVTWHLRSSTPSGLTGTQGWYSLALAVSPTDSNLVFTGGLYVYRNPSGGATGAWTKKNPSSVHVDDHDLVFSPDGSKLFLGCDGGIYQTTSSASTWTNLTSGILNTQMYHLGLCQSNANLQMYGAQDNDINLLSSGTWSSNKLHADGFEVAIDPISPNNMYGESQYGGIAKSTDNGVNFFDISSNVSNTEQGNWDTPFALSAKNHNSLIIGYTNIFKTTNGGNNFTPITSWTSGGVTGLAWFPKDDNVIYCLKGNLIYSTMNTTTWVKQSAYGVAGNTLSSICISPCDPLKIWVTASGYSAGHKVYYSKDGGLFFTNMSGTLPNVPVNTICYQDSTSDGLYIGTDIGVFAYDTTLHDWVAFNQGMPPVIVTEIEVQQNTKEVYCSTYGRGMWKSSVYSFPKGSCPVADVGIKNIEEELNNFIYPNPASTILNVDIKETNLSPPLLVEVFDMAGKLVTQQKETKTNFAINVQHLSAGQYSLMISNGEIKKSAKFSKN